ncbi:phospholipase D family protein [Brevibacterium oceani]|uniref:phospholipase D family protein n=1 Tax=Brevibacterium oceani TaxID=358099 RepID=UPI001B32E599|nr:phospholipase D family protein [Brevibacterium oceani]
MLAPNSRALLTDQLAPPPGYRFDAAVGTTFTVDFGAALLPTLPFSGLQDEDGSTSHQPDPVSVLEALRRVGATLDIFCQAGAIHVPKGGGHEIFAFLEPIIHEVALPKVGLFHPKVWFVRFIDADAGRKDGRDDEGREDGDYVFRLLVQSRNLTFDNSWDTIVRLDSVRLRGRGISANNDLSSFIAELPELCKTPLETTRSQRIAELADQARYIEWEPPEQVDGLSFHHLRPARRKRLDFDGRRHLIVSPFINDAFFTSERLGSIGKNRNITVLSRVEELDKLSEKTAGRVDSYFIDTMSALDTTDEDSSQLGRLHAKFYVIEPHGHRQRARLLLGSANATDAAFLRNVEFLIELEGAKKHLGVDAFMDENAPFRKLLKEYDPNEAETADDDDEQWDLDRNLRAIAAIAHTATVTAQTRRGDAADEYRVRVTADRPYSVPAGWSVDLAPISAPQDSRTVAQDSRTTTEDDHEVDVEFGPFASADITAFFILTVTNDGGAAASTIIRTTLVNPPSDRLDRIMERQIDTPEKFMRLIMLMLQLGDSSAGNGMESLRFDSSTGPGKVAWGAPGTLEALLRVVAVSPESLIDVDRQMRRFRELDADTETSIVPTGFAGLWTEVRKAAVKLGVDFKKDTDTWSRLV